MSTIVQTLLASFTRPNDTVQYSLNDLVANSTTPGSVVPLQFNNVISGDIVRCAMYKSSATNISANFRIHFWSKTAPALSAGDNQTFISTDFNNYLGYIGLTSFDALSTGAAAMTSEGIQFPFTGNTLFAHIQAMDNYQPTASEEFTIRIEYRSLTRNQRWDVES